MYVQDLEAANELKRDVDLSRLASLQPQRMSLIFGIDDADDVFSASAMLGVEGDSFGVPFYLNVARQKYRSRVQVLFRLFIEMLPARNAGAGFKSCC